MDIEKSLAKNSIYNVAYRMLNVLFPLITATYISRVLFAQGVGQVSYAQNIVSYFTTIAALGIPNYGTREIAKLKGKKELTNSLFTELFTINFISTALCTTAYYLMIMSIEYFQRNINLYMIIGMAIIFNFINVEWLYQGVEEYGYIAKRSFAVKILTLVSILVFVRTENDISTYAAIYCIGIGGNNLFNIINLRKYGVKVTVREVHLKKHLKPVLILLASAIAVELYTMVDTTMIGILCSDENVGYYTNAMKLIKILISVITAIGGVLLPRLSYYNIQGNIDGCSKIVNKVLSILIYFFVPSEIGILLVAGQIMPLLFGSSFEPGVTTLRIASLLICTLGFSNLFGTQILLTFGAEKKLLFCTIFGAIVNVILNAFLIQKFAQNGAALASVVSESIVTLLAILFSSRYISIDLDKKFLLSIAFSTVGMAIVVGSIQITQLSDILKLFISVVLGGSIYFLLSILTKNAVVFELLKLIKKKIR
ncbi:flippase [Eubacteriaceae bacterium ES3]|nr:flippase [Eubacteriaceae bacterium ES3]